MLNLWSKLVYWKIQDFIFSITNSLFCKSTGLYVMTDACS